MEESRPLEISILATLGLAACLQPPGVSDDTEACGCPDQERLQLLADNREELELLLRYVEVDDGGGVGPPTIRIRGANLTVQSGGSVATDIDGTGNIIVGDPGQVDEETCPRTGSGNLILGTGNCWTSYGEIVASNLSTIDAPNAHVIGGQGNTVSGKGAVGIGGENNTIRNDEPTGSNAVTIAGSRNTVTFPQAFIGGGTENVASGYYAGIVGGDGNTASGPGATVSGGSNNIAAGADAGIVGGTCGLASGEHSAKLGGGSDCTDNNGDGLYDYNVATDTGAVLVGG